MAVWGLTTFRYADTKAAGAGIIDDAGRIFQPDALKSYASLLSALGDWSTVSAALQTEDFARRPPLEGVVATVPIEFPNKLICAGANYVTHLREMGDAHVPDGVKPYFFFLPPSTSLVASGADVTIPADPDAKIDWEAEVAVVIGRRAKSITAAEAPDYTAGFACFNDITARGLLRRPVSLAPPFMFDWPGAKGLDGFCPMGPVTPLWRVGDPLNLAVRCVVNGETRQNGNTQDMIASIWELVAFASQSWTLEPGDVIATGTPAGVGHATGTYLKHGDEVRVEIDGLVSLSNRTVI